MIVIACVDDRMAMLFNRRRQSQDAALRQRLLQRAAGRTIWMSEYSARQFADCQADNIRVSDHCADQAGAGELWFVEDGRELIGARGAEELVLYRWNRSYPGDVTFPWPLTGWKLVETADFPGTSHEKITEEVYRP